MVTLAILVFFKEESSYVLRKKKSYFLSTNKMMMRKSYCLKLKFLYGDENECTSHVNYVR